MDKSICIATITSASGMHGCVNITFFTESPYDLEEFQKIFDSQKRIYKISILNIKAHSVVARLEGVTDRTAAERLRNTDLFIMRTELPDLEGEEYYHCDLIGLRVHNEAGEDIGKIVAVQNFGAGDLLEIESTAGESFYHSFAKEAAPEVNLKKGYVTIAKQTEEVVEDEEKPPLQEQTPDGK
jgi:16S rRNA processing protein RimM